MTDSHHDIVLVGINARYRHTSFGLRCVKAALGPLEDRARIVEYILKSDVEQMATEVLLYQPKIVGIGVYIWNQPQALQLVACLKERAPEVTVVLGGPEVSHETLGQPIVEAADYTVCGEGEEAFRMLAESLLSGGQPTQKIVDGGLPDLEALPSPYRLYSEQDIAHRVVYVEASRGCPFKCQFCLSSLDQKVRQIPLDRFLADMEDLMERGAQDFKFIDRTFNLKLSVSLASLEFFLARVDRLRSLHFEMIPDRLPEKLREMLAQFPPGLIQLEVGIQTFDLETAARIQRRQNYEATEANIRWLAEETEIHLHTDLIVGLPGESLECFGVGFDRLIAMGPQEIQVGILKRLKGTPIVMHDEAEEMRYNPSPPFEILSNRVLSCDEAEEMKHFSRLWDRFANSGNFVEAIPLLWDDGSSPFVGFRRFSAAVVQEMGQSYGISLIQLHRLLFAHLVERRGLDEERVRRTLLRDYQTTPGRKVPPFLREPGGPRTTGPAVETGGLARQSRHQRSTEPRRASSL